MAKSKVEKMQIALTADIAKVRAGTMSPKTGRSIAYMSCKVLSGVRAQLEYAKLKSKGIVTNASPVPFLKNKA